MRLSDYSSLKTNEITYPTTEMQPKILINKHVYDGTTHTFGGDSSMLNINKPIKHQGLNPVVNEHQMSAEYVPFEPTTIYNTPSI